MGYQVLARKWRPNQFSELVGQEHVVNAISNALNNNRLHHAYLFTGTRGVGKTTIARIFSKSLNCEKGMSATPCGQCHTCVDIEQGNYVDLLEIDAASRTKVEDTREILDNVQYKPTRGQFKVYLIDEVHMLSKHSFNALLKTLEEPPPHVKFLLATTDPQKLPVTILSRCLQFNLKALSREQIVAQLDHVLSHEQIEFQPAALHLLARAAQGSMRDALSLTDQAIAQSNGQVFEPVVTDMLGLMDKTQVLKLVHSIFTNQPQQLMSQVEQIASQAPDYAQLLAEIMSLLHQVALTQFVPEACKLETVSAQAIYKLAKLLPKEQVQLCYQIALEGRKDIVHAADGRSGLEMTLLRMLAFNPAPIDLSIEEFNRLAEQNRGPQTDFADVIAPAPIEQQTTSDKVIQPDESKVPEQELQDQDNLRVALESQQSDIVAQASTLAARHSPATKTEPVVVDQSVESSADDFDMQNDAFYQHQQENAQASDNEAFPMAPNPQSQVDSQQPRQNESTQSPSRGSTASLIALKDRLASQDETTEGGEPEVKKSKALRHESSLVEHRAGRFVPTDVSKQYETQSDIITPTPEQARSTQAADFSDTKDIDTALVTNQSEVINDAPFEVQSGDNQSQKVSVEHSQSLQSDVDDAPPWPFEVDAQTVQQRSEPMAEPSFDPNAHLEEIVDVEVDFDVPAFLESGEKVIAAQQLDTWSQLIEQMEVTALTKQLALHSSYEKNGDQITLKLLDSKPHLDTESARNQLQQALSNALQQPVTLVVEHTTPVSTPFAVQQSINQVRMEHAQKVVDTDEKIGLLKTVFSAQVVPDSIKPR